MKKWSEIQNNPEFQALHPLEQEGLRNQFFDQVVTPQAQGLGMDLADTRKRFDADTAPKTDWTDYPKLVGKGASGLVSAGGWAGHELGIPGADTVMKAGQKGAQFFDKSLSPGMRLTMAQPYLSDKPGEMFGPGMNLTHVAGSLAEMAPSLVVGGGVGAGVAKGLIGAGMGGVGAGLVGEAVGTAPVFGAMSGEHVHRQVMEMPIEKLRQSPLYQKAYNDQTLPKSSTPQERDQYAREHVADAVSKDAFAYSTLANAVFGAPTGAAVGKLIGDGAGQTFGRTVATQGALGAILGIPQGGSEQYLENIAMQQADPTRQAWQDVGEASVSGSVGGLALGTGRSALLWHPREVPGVPGGDREPINITPGREQPQPATPPKLLGYDALQDQTDSTSTPRRQGVTGIHPNDAGPKRYTFANGWKEGVGAWATNPDGTPIQEWQWTGPSDPQGRPRPRRSPLIGLPAPGDIPITVTPSGLAVTPEQKAAAPIEVDRRTPKPPALPTAVAPQVPEAPVMQPMGLLAREQPAGLLTDRSGLMLATPEGSVFPEAALPAIQQEMARRQQAMENLGMTPDIARVVVAKQMRDQAAFPGQPEIQPAGLPIQPTIPGQVAVPATTNERTPPTVTLPGILQEYHQQQRELQQKGLPPDTARIVAGEQMGMLRSKDGKFWPESLLPEFQQEVAQRTADGIQKGQKPDHARQFAEFAVLDKIRFPDQKAENGPAVQLGIPEPDLTSKKKEFFAEPVAGLPETVPTGTPASQPVPPSQSAGDFAGRLSDSGVAVDPAGTRYDVVQNPKTGGYQVKITHPDDPAFEMQFFASKNGKHVSPGWTREVAVENALQKAFPAGKQTPATAPATDTASNPITPSTSASDIADRIRKSVAGQGVHENAIQKLAQAIADKDSMTLKRWLGQPTGDNTNLKRAFENETGQSLGGTKKSAVQGINEWAKRQETDPVVPEPPTVESSQSEPSPNEPETAQTAPAPGPGKEGVIQEIIGQRTTDGDLYTGNWRRDGDNVLYETTDDYNSVLTETDEVPGNIADVTPKNSVEQKPVQEQAQKPVQKPVQEQVQKPVQEQVQKPQPHSARAEIELANQAVNEAKKVLENTKAERMRWLRGGMHDNPNVAKQIEKWTNAVKEAETDLQSAVDHRNALEREYPKKIVESPTTPTTPTSTPGPSKKPGVPTPQIPVPWSPHGASANAENKKGATNEPMGPTGQGTLEAVSPNDLRRTGGAGTGGSGPVLHGPGSTSGGHVYQGEGGVSGESSNRPQELPGKSGHPEGGSQSGNRSGQPRPHSPVSRDGRTRPTTGTRDAITDHPEPKDIVPRKPEGVLEAANYRITEQDRIGEGGLVQKANDNLEAIRTLRAIEAEGRTATGDEQAKLVRYVGWGGLLNMFPDQAGQFKSDWSAKATELRKLLSDDEYKSAMASLMNAHYTSEPVVRFMWEQAKVMGFHGGKVLEPGMGIGHFFGMMDPTLAARTHLHGVEMDSITGRIAKALYPVADIRVQPFEKAKFPRDHFDMVIGNVPFSQYKPYDPIFNKRGDVLHDYYFGKSIELTKPGGYVMFITSRYTMDKGASEFRQHLADMADLVGAIRLPNTAFKGNANTEVTTDIILLRRRTPGEASKGASFLKIKPFGPDKIPINEYFADHPDHMAGTMALAGSMYSKNEPTLLPKPGSLAQQLAEIGLSLEKQAKENGILFSPFQSSPAKSVLPTTSHATGDVTIPPGVKDEAYFVHNGVLYQKNGEDAVRVLMRSGRGGEGLSKNDYAIVQDLVGVRNAAQTVIDTQLQDKSKREQDRARQELNRVYDAFVAAHGPINQTNISYIQQKNGGEEYEQRRQPNLGPFKKDPDVYFIAALETSGHEKGTWVKAPIFTERVIQAARRINQVETPQDGLMASLDQKGEVDIPYIAGLMGKTTKEVHDDLKGMIYMNPRTINWETAERYLSGNVRDKLRFAEVAAKGSAWFDPNVAALKAVLPKDLPPSQIEVRLGAPWVPATDIEQFVRDLLGGGRRYIEVVYLRLDGSWKLDADYTLANSVEATRDWGTRRVGAVELIERALNQRSVTVFDHGPDDTQVKNMPETLAAQEKMEAIKDRFSKWIWEDANRGERLARQYNDIFNNTVLQRYDGSHLTFPGMRDVSPDGKFTGLRQHQKDGVWRVMSEGNTLLAHAVGAGKTIVMVASGMEMKRVGTISKPLYVVPNHMLNQFSREFLQLYPNAKIMVADETRFHTGRRRLFVNQVATGNWDAVVMTHSSFGKIPVSPETFNYFLQEEIDAYDAAMRESSGDRNIRKRLEAGKKALEQKLLRRSAADSKDDGIYFEQLGVDFLFLDEAHEFKNLGVATKMQNIKGISTNAAQKSQDLFVKLRHLDRLNPGRSAVFATGTPISNTMAEAYIMQKYLQRTALQEAGVDNFDSWAGQFGDVVTTHGLTPSGTGLQLTSRFARFVNLQQLQTMFRSMADVKTAEDLKLPVPALAGGKPIIVAAEPSPDQEAKVQELVHRLESLKGKKAEKGDDNTLNVVSEGRHVALDMRAVDPSAEDYAGSKVNKAVSNVLDTWKRTSDKRSTQLVFCDLSVPGAGRGFSVYTDMREKLLKAGVPSAEIAFMNDYDTPSKKQRLFDAVNAGDVRVLFGSTAKMGAGTNVQERLVALHHLDAPWKPSEVEQRDGRILRQGNTNKEVAIYRYVTKGTFDAYMWQTLEAKWNFIKQFMSGKMVESSTSDLDIENDLLDPATVKAIASGNPLVMEKAKNDMEVTRLQRLASAHTDEQFATRRELRDLPVRIKQWENDVAGYEAALSKRQETAGDKFAITVHGTRIDKRPEAGKVLIDALEALSDQAKTGKTISDRMIGSFAGFDLLAAASRIGKPEVYLKGLEQDVVYLKDNDSPAGIIQRLENIPRDLENRIEKSKEQIAKLQMRETEFKKRVDIPFEKEAELTALRKRQKEILDLLTQDTSKGGQGERQESLQTTDEARRISSRLVSRYSLDKVHTDEDGFSLLRGGGPTGRAVYIPMSPDGQIPENLLDVEVAVPSFIPPEKVASLIAAKKALMDKDKRLAAKYPDGPMVGTKQQVVASPSVPANIVPMVDGWAKLMGIKSRLYIASSADKFPDAHGDWWLINRPIGEALAVREPIKPGFVALRYNADHIDNDQQLVELLSHEFGHQIVAEYFDTLPVNDPTRQAIEAAWRTFERQANAGTLKDLYSTAFTPAISKKHMAELAHRGIESTLVQNSVNKEYLTSKDEWMANEVAKWMMSDKKPLSLLDKFFHAIAQALKKFYRMLQNRGLLPDKTISEWLEGLANNARKDAAKKPWAVPHPDRESERGAFSWAKKTPPSTGNPTLDSALGKIVRRGKKSISIGLNNLATEVRQGVFDRFDAIKQLEKGQDVPAGQSAYVAVRLTTSLPGVMRAIMEHGAPVWKGGITTIPTRDQGLMAILKPIGNDMDLFGGYLAGVRAKRLMDEKRERLFTKPEIDALVALGDSHPTFKVAARQYARLNKGVLDFAQSSGLIDPQERALWESHDYVPFYRLVDGLAKGPANKDGIAGQRSGIQRLWGGEEKLGDIIENILMNHAHLIDASMKNMAMQKTVYAAIQLVDKIEPADHEWKPLFANAGQMATALRRFGIDVENMTDRERAQYLKLFERVAPKGKDVVSVMVNGKAMYFHVKDPLLLRSVSALNQQRWGGIMVPLRMAKQVLTHSVTMNPAFMLRNFTRDAVAAWVTTDVNFHPGLASVEGLIKSWNEDPSTLELMAAGASFAGETDLNPSAMRDSIARTIRSKGYRQTLLDSPRKIFDLWTRMGHASESANRVAIYDAAIKAGRTQAEAAFMAKDVMDFSMRGDWTAIQFLAETVPFLNARMQGAYRLARGAKENPKSFAWQGLLVAAASLALWAINKDDQRYQELEEWDRDINWHVWVGDQHTRLPKPFEVGLLFATIPERMADLMMTGEVKPFLERMWWNLKEQLSMDPTPQIIKPWLEQYANKNYFTGRPIVGLGLERLPEGMQSYPWNSDTLKMLGETLGFSPAKAEHLINGYLGPIGSMVLMGSDILTRHMAEMPPKPAMSLDQMPLVSSFLRSPIPANTKYTTAMYDMLREVDKVYAGVLEQHRRTNNMETLKIVSHDNPGAAKSITDIGEAIRYINGGNATPEEKQQRVNHLLTGLYKTVLASGGSPAIPMELATKVTDPKSRTIVTQNKEMLEARSGLHVAQEALHEITNSIRAIHNSRTESPEIKRRQIDQLLDAKRRIAATTAKYEKAFQ